MLAGGWRRARGIAPARPATVRALRRRGERTPPTRPAGPAATRPCSSTTSRSPRARPAPSRRRASDAELRGTPATSVPCKPMRADDRELRVPAPIVFAGPSVSPGDLEVEPRAPGEEPSQLAPVAPLERLLKARARSEPFGPPARRRELILVPCEDGAQACLQADVHATGLASARNGVQRPAGSAERQQRNKQEVRDEFKPKAHGLQFRFQGVAADSNIRVKSAERGEV